MVAKSRVGTLDESSVKRKFYESRDEENECCHYYGSAFNHEII